MKPTVTSSDQDSRYGGMIDEPSPFDSLATWEQFLADMLNVPDSDPAKPALLRLARKVVAERRDAG